MGMYASLSKGDLIEMNNKKLSRLLEPNLKLYFLCMIVFAAATATVSLPLGLVEIACTVGLYAYFTNRNQKRRQNILQYIDNVTGSVDTASKSTLINSPLPIMVFRPDTGEVIWSNENFLQLAGVREHLFEMKVEDAVPDFPVQWMLEGKQECPDRVVMNSRRFRVYGSLVRAKGRGAEQNLVAASAGMAACGNKVFLATFAVFASMRACEQVRTFVCYPNLNVTVIGTHAGLQVGGDGATHAAIEDVSIMRSFPNMTVVQPADAVAARALAHAAVDFTGPLYVRLHRNPVADLYDPATYKFEWGKANTVVDNGSDMTMIVSGILLKKALDAAAILKEQGIGVRVLDMATIKPLDKEAVLKAAGETGAIMTIEDHSIFGGLGSAVAEVVVGNCPVPMEIVGIQDRFGESGDPELIYKDHGMDVDSIVAKAKALVARKG